MNNKVQKLKGFRDFYGQELKNRLRVIDIFRKVFEKYGFNPLETPALEYYKLLSDKYGEDEKLVYNFKDFGDRHVALKYDLTVPTTRFFIENQNDLKIPWRRYQIQPVWRADNTQKGRFREFYQCDADVIGVKSMVAEVEYILLGINVLEELGFADFVVRLNNRKILNALSQSIGREDKFEDIVYAIDKWEKRSIDKTQADLVERGLTKEESEEIVTLIKSVIDAEPSKKLDLLKDKLKGIEQGVEGIKELEFIIENTESDKVIFDLSIARGLAYYTGPIWEWNILEGDIGSVGGGGRYDELIGSLTGRDIPATGGSFGVERIIEVMNDREMFGSFKEDSKKALITIFDEKYLHLSIEMMKVFRDRSVMTELFPDIVSIKKQLDYANKNDFDYVVIIGEDEAKSGTVSLKNMSTGVQENLSIDEAISKINS